MNTSALPSPTPSQGSQSYSAQQNVKDNKVHSRNSSYSSRNYGTGNNNNRNKKNKKKHPNDRKNLTNENNNQNNNVDNTANNSKANAPDSNDAPGKVWNKQPSEMNAAPWW